VQQWKSIDMKEQVVSLSEWRRESRLQPRLQRTRHERIKRRAPVRRINVKATAASAGRSPRLSAGSLLIAGALFLTVALCLWAALKLDAIIVVELAKLWHLAIG
jgi:hypothetical protein